MDVDSELVVGREGVDLLLDDPEVSRRHARIAVEEEALVVEDLESLNGTWVNGERIEGRRVLATGDIVRVGDTTFEIRGAGEAQSADPARDAGGAAGAGTVAAEPPATATPRAAPEPAAVQTPPFVPPQPRPPARRRRGPATRRLTPTLIALAVVAADATALVAYFAGR